MSTISVKCRMRTQACSVVAAAFLRAILTIVSRSIAADSSVETEEDQLAKEVDDPTAILAQLKFQDLYTPQNYSTTAQTNTLQGRPVLPIQPFSFFPWQQLIRPTLKLETLATGPSGSTTTQFADM